MTAASMKTAHKIANAIATGTLNKKQKRKAISNWVQCMKTVLQGKRA